MNPFVSRLFNTPVALHPGHADLAITALADWHAGARAGRVSAFADLDDGQAERYRPYQVVAGVAVIPVKGLLVQRVGWLPAWLCELFGVTGYDQLRVWILDALADDAIDAIVLDVDSGGGDVAGCFDLVDTIHAARGQKPIWAILSENAYSAAYAIASAADPGRLYVPRTGGTGSVGVIYMHVSYAGALEKAGMEVTLITKGALKAELSDVAPLSKDAYDRAKADILEVGALFDATVARNRGLKAADVTATEAGTFLGAHGVDVGFADQVMAPDAAFRALLKELG